MNSMLLSVLLSSQTIKLVYFYYFVRLSSITVQKWHEEPSPVTTEEIITYQQT